MYNKTNINTHTVCCRIAWHQWWICEDKGQLGVAFSQKSVLEKYHFDLTFTEFQMGHQKLDIILENKVIQISKLSKCLLLNIKLSLLSLNEKNHNELMIFDIENFESQIYTLFESVKVK